MRMIDEDEVGLKEKPVREKYVIPTLPLLGLRTRESAGASRLKAPSGGVKYPGQVAPTTESLLRYLMILLRDLVKLL